MIKELRSPCSNQSACTFVSWLGSKCPLGWNVVQHENVENGPLQRITTLKQGWCGSLRVASLILKGLTSAWIHSGGFNFEVQVPIDLFVNENTTNTCKSLLLPLKIKLMIMTKSNRMT